MPCGLLTVLNFDIFVNLIDNVQLIPNYDQQVTKISTPTAKFHFHEDRNVTSDELNLQVSFYWRPLVNDQLINTFRNWNTPPYSSTPDFILMGN